MADEANEGQESQDTGTPEQEANTTPAEDPIRNLKTEFSRKLENMSAEFANINQALQQLANERRAAPAQPQAQKSVKDLLFEDPEAAAEIITQRARSEARADAEAMINTRVQMQNKITEVISEYPELSQASAQAEVSRIHSTLPKHLQNTAEGAELALYKAAQSMKLQPASTRRKPVGADDGYVPPSSGTRRSAGPAKDTDLNDEQYTFLHILNESIDRKVDEKVLKGAKKYAGRKNWTKYGTGDES